MWEAMAGGRWELWAAGTQVALSALILAVLFLGRRKARDRAATPAAQAGFEGEVLLQSLRQQAEQSLWMIRSAVEAEQARMQELLRTLDRCARKPAAAGAEALWDPRPFCFGAFAEQAAGAQGRYASLLERTARGERLEEAAAAAGLALDEAELALKVRRSEAGLAKAAARQSLPPEAPRPATTDRRPDLPNR